MSAEKHAKEVSAVRRFGPLAFLILAAQIAIAWVLIQALLTPKSTVRVDDDPMLAQEWMGEPEAPAEGEESSEGLPYYYQMDALQGVVVNPAGTEGLRYLLASLELGLKAYDRRAQPPEDDVTATLAADAELLKSIDGHGNLMRAIASEELSRRPIEVYEGRQLAPLQEVIRDRINREVLLPAFGGGEPPEIVVAEVVFIELVIQ